MTVNKETTVKHLYLEDLKEMTEAEVKEHIADEYAGSKSGFDYGEPGDAEKQALAEILKSYDIVVAYESVGSCGCDSASWFLLRNKDSGKYFEFSGSHCSCYGFEGQFALDEATVEYLKSDKFAFYCGGYDEHETENQRAVKEFLHAL